MAAKLHSNLDNLTSWLVRQEHIVHLQLSEQAATTLNPFLIFSFKSPRNPSNCVIAREDQGEFDTFLQFFSLVLSQELDLVTSLIINICIVVIRSLVHIELDWISLLREIWGNLILIHQSRTLVLDHKLSLVTLIFPNQ